MENMDSATVGAIVGGCVTVAGGLGTAMKLLYVRACKKSDDAFGLLSTQLEDCHKKHAECEQRNDALQKEVRAIDGRLQRLEGRSEGHQNPQA